MKIFISVRGIKISALLMALVAFSSFADTFESGWHGVTINTRQTPMKLEIANIAVEGSGAETQVVIDYRYRDERHSQLSISLHATGDAGAQYVKVPVGSLKGDLIVQAKSELQTGRIIWRVGQDWPNQDTTQLKVQLTADDRMFLVVDVSNGPEARFYPVTSLNSVPEDISVNEEYKTTKIVLRRLSKGSFVMGRVGDKSAMVHQVTLTHDFYVSVFEVTQRQWERVMGTEPSKYQGEVRPVENVSWADVRGGTWPKGKAALVSFMGKLGARTGLPFDLPTEAQWEYACRAGTTKDFNMPKPVGADSTEMGQAKDNALEPLAWYAANSVNERHQEVGRKIPNAWGLYDMHGNVYEWCLDWYGHYSGNAVDPTGSTIAMYKVYRGGSWFDLAKDCAAGARKNNALEYKNHDLGFRVSLVPPW